MANRLLRARKKEEEEWLQRRSVVLDRRAADSAPPCRQRLVLATHSTSDTRNRVPGVQWSGCRSAPERSSTALFQNPWMNPLILPRETGTASGGAAAEEWGPHAHHLTHSHAPATPRASLLLAGVAVRQETHPFLHAQASAGAREILPCPVDAAGMAGFPSSPHLTVASGLRASSTRCCWPAFSAPEAPDLHEVLSPPPGPHHGKSGALPLLALFILLVVCWPRRAMAPVQHPLLPAPRRVSRFCCLAPLATQRHCTASPPHPCLLLWCAVLYSSICAHLALLILPTLLVLLLLLLLEPSLKQERSAHAPPSAFPALSAPAPPSASPALPAHAPPSAPSTLPASAPPCATFSCTAQPAAKAHAHASPSAHSFPAPLLIPAPPRSLGTTPPRRVSRAKALVTSMVASIMPRVASSGASRGGRALALGTLAFALALVASPTGCGAAPVVQRLQPSGGPAGGGTVVTMTGAALDRQDSHSHTMVEGIGWGCTGSGRDLMRGDVALGRKN